MNTLLAASLFDNPWLLAVIVLGGALVNWLSKRRQGKQAPSERPGDAPPPPNKPSGEASLEEMLRRLLGGEPQPSPAPPPMRGQTQAQPPPIDTWMDEEARQSDGVWSAEGRAEEIQTAPAARPPRIARTGSPAASRMVGEAAAQAAATLAAVSEPGQRPVARVERRCAGRRAAFWHNPGNARRAFVASVVFAPPKGLQL